MTVLVRGVITPTVKFRFTVADQAIRKKLVFNQRTTGPQVGLPAGRAVLRIVFGNCAVGLHEVAFGRSLRIPVDACAALEFIGTALGHLVHDTAERTAEFRTVTTGLHLRFCDGLKGHLREVQVTERIGDVETVDEVLVFRNRCTAEGCEVTERRVTTDGARCEQCNRGGVTCDRNAGELSGAQNRRGFR